MFLSCLLELVALSLSWLGSDLGSTSTFLIIDKDLNSELPVYKIPSSSLFSSCTIKSQKSSYRDIDTSKGADVVSPTSGTSLVGKPRATYESAFEGLVGATASIHQMSHATDHPGSEPTLISDRSINISTQSHNALP
ncbi:hypothetical protein Tco_0482169 [Tanacetum coccineum]